MEPGHDPGIVIAVAAKGRRVNGGKNRDPDDQAIGPVESYDILSQGHYFWIGLCTVVRFSSPKNYTIKLRSSSLISLWFAFTHPHTFHLKLWQELLVLKNRWNITWTSRGSIFDSWYCNLDFNDFFFALFSFHHRTMRTSQSRQFWMLFTDYTFTKRSLYFPVVSS